MNIALLLASILIVLLGVVHSWLGERYILRRLFRRADLPRLFGSDLFTRRTLRFAWHLTTVVWLGVAGLMLLLAGRRAETETVAVADVGVVLMVTSLASALVALVGSRGRHPAWAVFLAVAALAWAGTH